MKEYQRRFIQIQKFEIYTCLYITRTLSCRTRAYLQIPRTTNFECSSRIKSDLPDLNKLGSLLNARSTVIASPGKLKADKCFNMKK
jgi:hypothetical protein